MSHAAGGGIKADVQIAVRRKGEDKFTPVETKKLPQWAAELLAKMKGIVP